MNTHSEPPPDVRGPWPALGLFLVSAAVLALQVLQTRILSVMMWHHHSYMVVTMTLLGFAAAGSLVTVWPSLLRGDVRARLAWCSTLFAVSTLAGYQLLSMTADRAAEMTAQGDYVTLSVFYSYLLVPYFFGGLVITLCLSAARDVHRLYFVNLIGSAVGAWAFIALIAALGGERLLVLCALAGPLAGLAFVAGRSPAGDEDDRGERSERSGRRRVAGVGAAVTLVAGLVLFAVGRDWLEVGVSSTKAMAQQLASEPGAKLVLSRWSSLCRLDLVELPESKRINIYQDGDAITVMHSDASWELEPKVALNTLAYVPHRQELERDPGAAGPKALAIGIGGGIDLRFALDQGVSHVLGIEINPETVRLVGEELREFNADVYHRPGVEVRVGEGRSTLRRLDERFDVIQLSGTDTYTAGNAGAYVLSESYLYTSEALREYFDHLAPGGTLGMIRLAYDPPRENLRLFAIALSELRRRGVARPSDHAAVIFHEIPHPATGEIIRFSGCVFSLDPLPAESIAYYRQADQVPGYRVMYLPGAASDGAAKNEFAHLAAAIDAGTEEEFYDAYRWEVAPVSDDSPFFFNFHSWSALWSEASETRGWHDLTGGPIGLRILGTLLVQTSVLTALLVLLPLAFLRSKGLRGAHAGRHLAYFLGLGAGFMFLEISTIQRLVLFLGHPTYSLTVVLSCFLFFAGLGSLYARRFMDRPAGRLRAIVALLALGIVLLAVALELVLDALLFLPLAGRIAVVVALLAPINFLMGMPFPIGLARLRRLAPPLVPWALGANGAASVVGSILCIVIAMESGFRAVSVVAVVAYALGTALATSGPLSPERSGG